MDIYGTEIIYMPDQLWDPSSLLPNGYQGLFSPRKKQPGHEADHLHLVPRLKMHRAIPQLPKNVFMA
jgi:hypothetical protein